MAKDLSKLNVALQKLATRKKYWRIEDFEPYDKQCLFFAAGAKCRERLFMAGNQLGKTYAGACEAVYHLTGLYPEWWVGRRFDKPVRAWAAGESSLLVRDTMQKLLCGEPGVDSAFGTGLIPKDLFVDKPSLARGVTDAFDTIQVRHVSGGVSVLRFKSYEQGREKFQGETIDFFWGDEEPPENVYAEMLTRITATRGMGYITFTPLKGMSKVVIRFLNDPSEDRSVTRMAIEDAKHIPAEERAKIIAGYLPHERDARSKGTPLFGRGLIFQVSEALITEPPLTFVPEHWHKIWAIDFGIGHPFAAVLLLWDKDPDVIHIHHCIRLADEGAGSLPVQHAKAMKQIAANIPVAWPQDGTAREKGTGKPLSDLYKAEGLRMLADHATWPDGSISTWAAIKEMQDRMTTGRFKVAATLTQWFEEFRMYHTEEEGKIVKLQDDLLSATQKGVMMKRFAVQEQLGGRSAANPSRKPYIAEGTPDYDDDE